MDERYYTIEHRKGQHITGEERGIIQAHTRDGWTTYKIAKDLGRPYNTVKNEINRGTVFLYNGTVKRYKAKIGASVYRGHRKNSVKKYKWNKVSRFIDYIVEHFKGLDHWSLDACRGRAVESGYFERSETVCTKTLYNYVDRNLIEIENSDLPEKLKYNTKKHKIRQNKRNLGRSIEERPETVNDRKEFGHWEIDSVLGIKNASEPVILTLVERMSRNSLWIKIKDHSAGAVTEAVTNLKNEYGKHYKEVFKTITADNGSEFAELSAQETEGSKIYFTHPYSSWEKGTNERHNRMIRRFIPKRKSIGNYTEDDIALMSDWSNGLPRKILDYRTPEEIFDEQLDRIYRL